MSSGWLLSRFRVSGVSRNTGWPMGADHAAREVASAKDAQFASELALGAGDADVGGAARDGADHLRRVRLHQMQVDQRIGLAKVLDDRQQGVARHACVVAIVSRPLV